MKVLFLSNNCGGLVSFRLELIQRLIDENNDVVVAAAYGYKTSILTDIGCKFIRLDFDWKGKNPIKDFQLIRTYHRIIKNEKPNIVLTYTIKPNLYGGMACGLTHTPHIANVTGLGIATEHTGWLRSITFLLYKAGLRKTSKVFFQNKENLDFCLTHKLIKVDYELIPGSGVNVERFHLQPYPDDGVIRFLFCGRILKKKGIEQYLQAAEEIKKRHPNTEFHILGGCEDIRYKETIKTLSQRGLIIYHGVTKDTRPFLENIHCVVHPSFYPEGMSNVLLESCSTGRPVITTDKAGCGDVVEEGKNGFIVRQQDTMDLIDKIEMFIMLPYSQKKEMGLYAREKMNKEFNRNIVIDAYMRDIKKLSS